jgi:hypothetical protein
MTSNGRAVRAVSFWPYWQLLLFVPLPLRVYKYGGDGGMKLLLVTREQTLT